MLRAQFDRAQAEPLRRAGGEVLHEDVGLLHQSVEHRLRTRMLHVEREALLGAVDPDEMRGLSLHRAVVAARRVAAAGPLDLDDARAQLRQLARAERARDDLLQADDE